MQFQRNTLLFLSLTFIACCFLLGCSQNTADKPEDNSRIEDEDRFEGRGINKNAWWTALPRSDWTQYERVHEDIEWFEIYRIRPDIYAIYEPHHFEESISFLITGKEKSLLFDTGVGIANIKKVTDRIIDNPLIVLNSHAHYDHTGGNHLYKNLYGIDNPYAQMWQNGMPHEMVKGFVNPAWFNPHHLPEDFNPEDYRIKPYKISKTVKDGHIIELGGHTLEILHLPGHSPDTIALLDEEHGQLFVGDIFYLAPLYAHLEESDFRQYHESAKKLARLAPKLIDVMTAHNVPIVSPDYLTKMLRAFDQIVEGELVFTPTDGVREYHFNGFTILTKDIDYDRGL